MENRAFTLIELMVTVSLISLLSVLTLANFRQGNKQFALTRSAYQLAQGIRRAEEMAISSQEFKGAFQGGFGIHLTLTPTNQDRGQYTLFVDCDNDNQFDEVSLTCSDCTGGSCTPNSFSEKVETIFLEKGIYISELSPSAESLVIKFYPPDPVVTINPDASLASVSLTFGQSQKKEVKINKAGLIEIK